MIELLKITVPAGWGNVEWFSRRPDMVQPSPLLTAPAQSGSLSGGTCCLTERNLKHGI